MITFRRPVQVIDFPILQEWIQEDADHREKITPDFFFSSDGFSLVLVGHDGPGLYVRVDPEIPISARLHIQFSPDKVKSGKTLLRGWKEFKQCIQKAGVTRLVFESTSTPLIGFCKRCFGFKQVENSNDYEVFI